MVPLHRGRFFSCAPIFKFFYGLTGFLGANLYQKLLFLAIMVAVRPHF